jgi:hypothetical protein
MNKYSNDVINNITLGCLVNKQQLTKLNRKISTHEQVNKRNEKQRSDIRLYRDELIVLFSDLLDEKNDTSVSTEIKCKYNEFVRECLAYCERKRSIHTVSEEIEDAETEDRKSDEDEDTGEENRHIQIQTMDWFQTKPAAH